MRGLAGLELCTPRGKVPLHCHSQRTRLTKVGSGKKYISVYRTTLYSRARDHRTTTACIKYNGLAVPDVPSNVHTHIHNYRRRKSNLSQHTA